MRLFVGLELPPSITQALDTLRGSYLVRHGSNLNRGTLRCISSVMLPSLICWRKSIIPLRLSTPRAPRWN